jgi:hypothetical protein
MHGDLLRAGRWLGSFIGDHRRNELGHRLLRHNGSKQEGLTGVLVSVSDRMIDWWCVE